MAGRRTSKIAGTSSQSGRRSAGDNPVDPAMEALAKRLLHHLDVLAATPKKSRPREWADETEIGRRAAALIRACHRLWHVPGPNLAELCERVLGGARVPSTAVTARNFTQWCRAVRAEATTAPGTNKPATVRAVTIAAFGRAKADDRSKDIRAWRKTPEYEFAVMLARWHLERHGSPPPDSSLRSFTESPGSLSEGLAPIPGEKR